MNKPSKTVLLIDDDPDDFDMVFEACQDIDPAISVRYLRTCEEARQYRQEVIDLVLLDINMPVFDGFYWLKLIRGYGYTDLPIIMYTNSLSPLHIEKAYNEGANLYYSKPDSYISLKKGLAKLIQMDWSNPFLITRQYQQDGRYTIFSV